MRVLLACLAWSALACASGAGDASAPSSGVRFAFAPMAPEP